MSGIGRQELFNNGISNIPMMQPDSSEQLLILRDNFLNLKYEVDHQITTADIYPVTVWKNNYCKVTFPYSDWVNICRCNLINFIFKVKKIVT